MKNAKYYIGKIVLYSLAIVAFIVALWGWGWCDGTFRPQTITIKDGSGRVIKKIDHVYDVKMHSSSISYQKHIYLTPTYQIKLKNSQTAETEFK